MLPTRPLRLLFAVAALAGAGFISGCHAHAHAEYVEPAYEPVHVDVYPHTVYEGRVVYLIDDRWYWRDGRRWVVYRHEPAPLRHHRVHVLAAPRVHRAPVRVAPGHAAPPARRAAPVHVAPAAPHARHHRRVHREDSRERREDLRERREDRRERREDRRELRERSNEHRRPGRH